MPWFDWTHSTRDGVTVWDLVPRTAGHASEWFDTGTGWSVANSNLTHVMHAQIAVIAHPDTGLYTVRTVRTPVVGRRFRRAARDLSEAQALALVRQWKRMHERYYAQRYDMRLRFTDEQTQPERVNEDSVPMPEQPARPRLNQTVRGAHEGWFV